MAPGRKKAAKKWAKDDPNATPTAVPIEKKEIVPYMAPVQSDASGSEVLPSAQETDIPPASATDEAAEATDATDTVTEAPAPPAEDAASAEDAAPAEVAAPVAEEGDAEPPAAATDSEEKPAATEAAAE